MGRGRLRADVSGVSQRLRKAHMPRHTKCLRQAGMSRDTGGMRQAVAAGLEAAGAEALPRAGAVPLEAELEPMRKTGRKSLYAAGLGRMRKAGRYIAAPVARAALRRKARAAVSLIQRFFGGQRTDCFVALPLAMTGFPDIARRHEVPTKQPVTETDGIGPRGRDRPATPAAGIIYDSVI